MKDEIVIYTHNDLDALGSMLNIEFALPNITKTYFHTNYKDIVEQSHATIEYLQKHNIKLLMITDVSFAENKNLLDSMVSAANSLGIKVIYLDHHVYPDGFFDGFIMNYVHDMTKSATLITHEFFNNGGKCSGLDNITRVIDVFDIWRMKEPEFRDALDMNEYFWRSVNLNSKNIEWLMNEILQNNYRMPNNYFESVKSYSKESKTEIEKFYNKGLIHCDGFTTIAFVDTYYNDILYDEFLSKKIEIVLIVNSYGIIRVRFNNLGTLSDDTKRDIKRDLECENVGHLNAFPILVRPVSFHNIMEKIKLVSSIISKHKTKG